MTQRFGLPECPNCPGVRHWPHQCENTPEKMAARQKEIAEIIGQMAPPPAPPDDAEPSASGTSRDTIADLICRATSYNMEHSRSLADLFVTYVLPALRASGGADDAERARTLRLSLKITLRPVKAYGWTSEDILIAEAEDEKIFVAFASIRAALAAEHEKAMALLLDIQRRSYSDLAQRKTEAEARAIAAEAAVVGLREAAEEYMAEMVQCHPLTGLQTILMDKLIAAIDDTAPLSTAIAAQLRQEGAMEEREACARILDGEVKYQTSQIARMADSERHRNQHNYAANVAERIAAALRAPEAGAKPQGEG